MLSLANPLDVMDAYKTQFRVAERDKALEGLSGKAANGNYNFADVLSSSEFDLLKGERSLIKAIDHRPEDDKSGSLFGNSRGPFQAIIGAQVAAAVGHVYGGENFVSPEALEMLGAESFLTPAGAIANRRPDLGAAKKAVAAASLEPGVSGAMDSIMTGLMNDSFPSLSSLGNLAALGAREQMHPLLAASMGFYERNAARRT